MYWDQTSLLLDFTVCVILYPHEEYFWYVLRKFWNVEVLRKEFYNTSWVQYLVWHGKYVFDSRTRKVWSIDSNILSFKKILLNTLKSQQLLKSYWRKLTSWKVQTKNRHALKLQGNARTMKHLINPQKGRPRFHQLCKRINILFTPTGSDHNVLRDTNREPYRGISRHDQLSVLHLLRGISV